MRVMVFCSNPVNGGTARVFLETVEGLKKNENLKIFPCVNANNNVEIYKKITDINYLDIVSEQSLFYQDINQSFIIRILKKIKNSILYYKTKKKNISIVTSFLKKNAIDVVLIHNGGYVGDDLCNQVLYAAFLANIQRRIYVFHSDMDKGMLRKLRYMHYDHMLDKCATELLTVSNYTKNRIKDNSYIRSDIRVVYNGMTINNVLDIDSIRNNMQIDCNKKNILMIGNFSRNKGQDHFVEVANILYNEDNEYRFIIIGNIYDDEFYQECEDKIKKYKLENIVKVYSGIHNASEYIKAFDVLVVTSLYDESFGLISLEAMVNAKPVVAFACGGIPEVVINGRNGFVVDIGDDMAMARSIKEIVDNPELREKIGENNKRDFYNRFSVDEMVSQYSKIIIE